MILNFKTHLNGKPTNFVEKILLGEKASKTKSNIRKKGNVYDFCTFCETDSCLVKHIFVEVTS